MRMYALQITEEEMERKRDYMMTVQELTKNEKYKFWYFKIKELMLV